MLIWVGVAIGLPLIARALHEIADALENRGAPPVVHHGLRQAGGGVDYLRSTLRGDPSGGNRS